MGSIVDPVEAAMEYGAFKVERTNAAFLSEGHALAFQRCLDPDYFWSAGPEKVGDRWIVQFIDLAEEGACHVCGNAMYFYPETWEWGHANRVRWMPSMENGEDGLDRIAYVRVINAFLHAYWKPPDGYTLQQAQDHGLEEHDECEFCARQAYGCPR